MDLPAEAALAELLRAAEQAGVRAREVGETGGSDLEIKADGATVKLGVAALAERWATALPRALGV